MGEKRQVVISQGAGSDQPAPTLRITYGQMSGGGWEVEAEADRRQVYFKIANDREEMRAAVGEAITQHLGETIG